MSSDGAHTSVKREEGPLDVSLTLLRVLPCLCSAPSSAPAANTLKVIPNNAIRWMVFEHLKQSAYFKRLFVSFNVPEKSPDTQSAPKGRLN